MIESVEDESDRTFMIHLYEQYDRIIRKTIYKVTYDLDSLEDLTQDTYEKLIKKVSTIRSLECHKLVTYVVYTSKSVAINYIKHRDVVQKHAFYGNEDDLAEDLQNFPDGIEEQSIQRLDVESVLGAIAKLSEAKKDILYFKYFLDMSDDEIAKIMNISSGNVRQYLRRARNAAKALINGEVTPNAKS